MTLCASITSANGAFSPGFMALDPNGDLFISNNFDDTTSNIVEFNQPTFAGTPSLTMTKGILAADNLHFDSLGNLIVFNHDNNCFIENYCKNEMNVYAPPYTGAPSTVLHIGSGLFLAANSAGDIFVSTSLQGGVAEYSPPYTHAPKIISHGYNSEDVGNAAIDENKNLWVGFVTRLVEYAYPYTGAPIRTIVLPAEGAVSQIGDIVFNGTELFVYRFEFNVGGAVIRMYKSPYTSAPFLITNAGRPLKTIGVSAFYKQSMVIDENGNLLVAGNIFPAHDGPQPLHEWKNVDNYQQPPISITVNMRPWHMLFVNRP